MHNFHKGILLRNLFENPHKKQIKNKPFTYEEYKTAFLASRFETGLQSNKSILARFIVLQDDLPLCVQTYHII